MKNSFIVISFLTLLYRTLGFFREIFIANIFGGSTATDNFFVSLSIPNIVVELLAIGAISSAIIPVLSEKDFDYKLLKEKVGILIGNFFSISILIMFLFIFFKKEITNFFVPGVSEGSKMEINKMVSITLLTIPVLFIASILASVLTLKFKAYKVTLGNLIQNLFFLLLPVCLLFYFKANIFVFIYSFLISIILKYLYLYFSVYKTIGYVKIKVDFKDECFKKISYLLLPIIFSSIGTQVNYIVDKIVASSLEVGSISYLTYSNKLIQMPLGIILGSIVLTDFPKLVNYVKQEQQVEIENFIKRKILMIFFFFLPLVTFTFFFSKEIIDILFGRGAFKTKDILITAKVLQGYSFLLFLVPLNVLFQNIYYSYKKTILPATINILSVVTNIILNIILVKIMGIIGIALATIISLFISIIIFTIFFKRNYYSYKVMEYIDLLKIILVNILLVIFVFFIKSRIFYSFSWNSLLKFFSLGFYFLFYLVIYTLLLKVTRVNFLNFKIER